MTKGSDLGRYKSLVDATLAELDQKDIVARMWRGDHTVWKDDPTEISNRLGWLNVTDVTSANLETLNGLADAVKSDGIKHVVLLGMGGSSLGPEVLRQVLGSASGYPELIVLDSTVPARVQSVTDAIDPEKTVFIVSSKSGSTIEPNVFYKHFWALVEDAVGKDDAGSHFIAVTDPGSNLDKLGGEQGFRHVFGNPTELGGRYSVMSYFGMAPAALIGADVPKLIERADSARAKCSPNVSTVDNPGAWLGAVMGTLAKDGRDKLTLVTSPSVEGFGLWIEQLIAESTGKEGKGIIPIAGEPLLGTESYGNDRLFVYVRLEGDDNAETDAFVETLSGAGHPVVRLDMRDAYDIGAQFYLWEFAVAIAGSILQINPFDQPNVESAKVLSIDSLKAFESSGSAPKTEAISSMNELMSKAKLGDYLAIMAYVEQTPEVDAALNGLRRKVMERHKIATTLGYGPRFLHSTGQIHKGGPASGLFLQIIIDHDNDIQIPDERYTFGVLADAQAVGDYGALEAKGRRTARINLQTALDESKS